MEFLAHGGKRTKKQTNILVSQLVAGTIQQGSPAPRPQTGTGPWPVRNWASHQEVDSRRASAVLSVFAATPHHLPCCLNSASVRFCIVVSCLIISLYVTTPGEGKGDPLQYSCLENSLDCIVQGVAKSQTWLGDFHFHICHNVIIIEIKLL